MSQLVPELPCSRNHIGNDSRPHLSIEYPDVACTASLCTTLWFTPCVVCPGRHLCIAALTVLYEMVCLTLAVIVSVKPSLSSCHPFVM